MAGRTLEFIFPCHREYVMRVELHRVCMKSFGVRMGGTVYPRLSCPAAHLPFKKLIPLLRKQLRGGSPGHRFYFLQRLSKAFDKVS